MESLQAELSQALEQAVLPISAVTNSGLDTLLQATWSQLGIDS